MSHVDVPTGVGNRRKRLPADHPEAVVWLAAQQPKPRVAGGPGTELKKLLASWGITDSPTCPCNARAAEMDRNGVAWCREHRATVIGWLREGAAAWGWAAKLAAKAMPIGRLVDEAIRRADVGSAILITGGIGDVFALEATMTPEERERLETIHYACPARREISQLFQALPNYPRLKNHVMLPTGGQVYYDIAAVTKDHGTLPGVQDWSINARFPMRRPYVGSSFLTHRLATQPPINRRYVVVVPASRGFGQWAGRDFDGDDWVECLDFLEREQLAGVVLGRERSVALPSSALIDLRGQTSILESVELLKAAVGYLGIDSCLSVLAAKLFAVERLAVKSVWDHCYANQATYYAPRTEFGFLTRTIRPPTNRQPGKIVVTTCQGIGDAFWAYQKLAPHYSDIAFRIAQINGGAGKSEGRARDWLLMLPKVSSVSFRRMTHEAYEAMAHATHSLPRQAFTADYCANGPLESGIRLEAIDPGTEIVETVELPDEPVELPDDFVCLYVSGDTCRETPRAHSRSWTIDQWAKFLMLTGEKRFVMVGAAYDRIAIDALSKRFEIDARVDLRPAQVLHILRRCRYFIGYQSGLNVMADQVDAKQIMLYFPALEKMLYTWCKPRNIRTRFHADVFREPGDVFSDLRRVAFFDASPVDAGRPAPENYL